MGDPSRPLTDMMVLDKFCGNATYVGLADDQIASILDSVMRLEDLPDRGALFSTLAPPGSG